MTLYLNDLGIVCALGHSKTEIFPKLLAGDRSGLQTTDEFSPGHPVTVGRVTCKLPEIPERHAFYDCRNNRLLLVALSQIASTVEAMMDRHGRHRIGIVLGTSTSGVRNTELALAHAAETGQPPASFHYKQQQLGAGADFLADYLGITGPTCTLSTACSSSGKAFASARRLINLDLCDAVIVGGADSLCGLTVNGFAALESVSAGLCKPFGLHRDGINIGEAATLFVLSRQPGPVCLRGIGATSDAYHFSAPDPDAGSVIKAMRTALAEARMAPEQVDYLNLHGTATALNDAMEAKAVHQVFGAELAVSASKGMTGHTLGAAAALELGFCWLLLNSRDPRGTLIPHVNDDETDDSLPAINLIAKGQQLGRPIVTCQSNSFAFGGNNISIVISRT
ncbi:MAG: beta-ketoacyl-[acyl-carrier-protein] synthase family protein [Methylococcaceae bacterium]|nr:beta-ketoacyl-[acyl-carrier-protein] synthase family protein [Methylococcaceae bacterium]